MPNNPDRRLIRYLHGELPAAEVRALRAELARDAALAARLAELDRMWQGLRPPPPTPAPFGYVPRLQRLADARQAAAGASLFGWGAAPPWARALAGAALVAGTVLGVGLGRLTQGVAPVLASAPSPGVEAPATAPVTSAPRAPEPAFGSSPSAASLAAPEPSTAPRAGAPTPPAVDGGEPAGDATDALEVAPLGEGSTFAEEYWQALVGSNTEAGSSGEADAWGATESDTQ